MVKFAHTDHLDQGSEHASQGGGKSKPSGSHLKQGTHGASSQGPSGDHLSGTPGLVSQGPSARDGKDHLTPHPALTDASPGRGAGGSTAGKVDRTMERGAGKSGDHMAPQPGLANAGKKQKVINPYTPRKS